MMYLLFCLALSVSGGVDARQNFVTLLSSNGHYKQFLDLLNQTGLTQQLLDAGNLTLFAPTDAAFARLPAQYLTDLKADPQRLKNVMEYHAVVGKAFKIYRINDVELTSLSKQIVRVNMYGTARLSAAEGVKVIWGNRHVNNGYVHGLDGVMIPPEGDIIDILSSRPDMTNLTSLLKSTGLVDKIKADHNMTFFAPTDAAFANVNPDVMEWLEKHPNNLKEVLLYHTVLSSTLYKIGMRHSMTFSSGDSRREKLLLVEDFTGNVYINRAQVSEVDISATNGVIHVIDDVLIPTRQLLYLQKAHIDLN